MATTIHKMHDIGCHRRLMQEKESDNQLSHGLGVSFLCSLVIGFGSQGSSEALDIDPSAPPKVRVMGAANELEPPPLADPFLKPYGVGEE